MKLCIWNKLYKDDGLFFCFIFCSYGFLPFRICVPSACFFWSLTRQNALSLMDQRRKESCKLRKNKFQIGDETYSLDKNMVLDSGRVQDSSPDMFLKCSGVIILDCNAFKTLGFSKPFRIIQLERDVLVLEVCLGFSCWRMGPS